MKLIVINPETDLEDHLHKGINTFDSVFSCFRIWYVESYVKLWYDAFHLPEYNIIKNEVVCGDGYLSSTQDWGI